MSIKVNKYAIVHLATHCEDEAPTQDQYIVKCSRNKLNNYFIYYINNFLQLPKFKLFSYLK